LSFKVNKIIIQALFIAPVLFMFITSYSCKRADEELFLQDSSFDHYLWEDNTGEKIFESPDTFLLPISEILRFTVNSQDPTTSNQVKIQAAFFGNFASISQDSLIIFCHDGQFNMDFYYEQIKTLYQCGQQGKYNILLFDYQGLGLSDGTSSFEAIIQDANAIGKWLKESAVPSQNIIVYGQGLGAIAACHLVKEDVQTGPSPSTLILENPLANTDHLLSTSTGLNIPNSFIGQPTIDNIAIIKDFKGSLLMLLSVQDEKYDILINGEELYNAHNGQYKELHRADATHQNLVPKLGFPTYCELIDQLILKP
jgi:alpha/beta superfamily hydrolase